MTLANLQGEQWLGNGRIQQGLTERKGLNYGDLDQKTGDRWPTGNRVQL